MEDQYKKSEEHFDENFRNPKAFGRYFRIHASDDELLKFVYKNDALAVLELTIKHLPSLKYLVDLSNLSQRSKDKAMSFYLSHFASFIKERAKHHNEHDGEDKLFFHSEIYNLFGKRYKHLNEYLGHNIIPRTSRRVIRTQEVSFLNKLNNFLSLKGKEMVDRAKEDLPLLQKRVDNKELEDFNYKFEISYFDDSGSGDPLYTCDHPFRYFGEGRLDDNLLCNEEDWRETNYLPTLENPYCYLMHELVYHSHIHDQIFDVKNIWVDLKIDYQEFFSIDPDFNWLKGDEE